MFQVLIVDDEVHAVRGLQAGVQWDKLAVDEVHTAHSLRQAQDVFRDRKIHLLICDIEMPQGSGIELTAWVREQYPDTETIFLTCHSDFSFAKQAIQLNSFDYLLKPVDYSELETVLAKALGKIKKESELRSFEEVHNRYHQLWEAHKPVVADRFWQDLIQKKLPAIPKTIGAAMQSAGLSYREGKYLPVYTRVQRWNKELSDRDQRIMEYALRNVLEEIMNQVEGAAIIPVHHDSLLTVIPVDAPIDQPKFRSDCDSFIQNCNQYLYCDISCYVGDPVQLHEMADMLYTLQRLEENNVTRINRTIFLGESKRGELRIPTAPLAEWAEWMKQGARDKLREHISRYLESWKELEGGVDAEDVHSFYQDFMQMIYFVLQSKGLQANQVFARNLLTHKPESVLRSLTALQEWVGFIVEVALNHIHSIEENLSVANKVKRFIAEKIGEQSLSREDIANHVFLNPDYLTRIFKKETGLSLSDFLQQSRIEHAKELLVHSGQSISDIALASGYSNLSYFSTIFKKSTGMNPLDYRRRSQTN
ncbi:helix-turn-helix domain-containing protein [Cohnella boryungensis]|uniref:Helix-turn-helix domain-containing protein n=1 Tax=Cohnella boryungensis TaxID=768479 RepID=A0ABV8SHY4_9BACL